MDVGCIILAGGEGKRFGRQKAWVELGGSTLLQRAVSNLEFFRTQIIVVKAHGGILPRISSRLNFRITEDAVSGNGPLGGILAGMEKSEYASNLVVACDMPWLNEGLLRYMASLAGGYDVVVPRVGRLVEPLQAIYSKDCIPGIKELITMGRPKVDLLFEKARTRFVDSPEIERFDPARMSFANINTPEDLEIIERSLEEREAGVEPVLE